ncbi:unnamed protein product [Polarella glacialis]|uniref:Uncharacterized protein n=1 Tax=Polarella glacialis TaxID=89957 RepID=A0A813GPD4_POLGL|nr:unnamed protein product [Polarella glacialis]
MSKFIKIAITENHGLIRGSLPQDEHILKLGSDIQRAWTSKKVIADLLFDDDQCCLAINKGIPGIPSFGPDPPGVQVPLADKIHELLPDAVVPYVGDTADKVPALIGLAANICEKVLHLYAPLWENFPCPRMVNIFWSGFLMKPERFFSDCVGTSPKVKGLRPSMSCLEMLNRKEGGLMHQLCDSGFKDFFEAWLLNGDRVWSSGSSTPFVTGRNPTELLAHIILSLTYDEYIKFREAGAHMCTKWAESLDGVKNFATCIAFLEGMESSYLALQFGPDPRASLPATLRDIIVTTGDRGTVTIDSHPILCCLFKADSCDTYELEHAMSLPGVGFPPGFYNSAAIAESAPDGSFSAWSDLQYLSPTGAKRTLRRRFEVSTESFVLSSLQEPTQSNVAIRMAAFYGTDGIDVASPCLDPACWRRAFLINRDYR